MSAFLKKSVTKIGAPLLRYILRLIRTFNPDSQDDEKRKNGNTTRLPL
jgi:hypothetical protein